MKTMSIYGSKPRKIYPHIHPMVPSRQEVNLRSYRPAKISKVGVYFLCEMAKREKLAKKLTF